MVAIEAKHVVVSAGEAFGEFSHGRMQLLIGQEYLA